MTTKLYMAYSVILANRISLVNTDKHLTMCFMDAAEVKKLPMANLETLVCKEFKVEYWPGPDITVIVVEDTVVNGVQKMLDECGYTYNEHEFKPHITMCKGDQADLVSTMLRGYSSIHLTTPYISVKEFND